MCSPPVIAKGDFLESRIELGSPAWQPILLRKRAPLGDLSAADFCFGGVFCFLSCIVTMLAHGTGGCQWLAVIVFFFLGGVWIHDPIVSCVDEGFVTKLMAPQKLRLQENFCALDFMVQTTASGVQECDSGGYQAEFDWLGPFNASSEVVVGTNWLVGQNSRLTENFCAYDFMASNSTSVAQEYGSMGFKDEQDHLGMLNSNVVGEFDESDMLDQFDYVGHLVVGFDRPGQHFKRQECLRRAPWVQDFHVLLFCFLSNIAYSRWKNKNAMSLMTKSSDWVAYGHRRRIRFSHNVFGYAAVLFWSILFLLCAPTLGVTCRSCFDGIAGCTGGANCPLATQTAANLAVLAVAGAAAIDVTALIPPSYVRHLPTQVLRTLAAIARVPAGGGQPDLGAMNLQELSECLTSGRIEITAYKNELSTRLADPATVAAQVTRISAMLAAAQGNVATNTRVIDGINSYGVLGYLVAAASLIVSSGKRTYSSGTSNAGSGSSSGSSLSIRTPTSGSQFAELLMVWQTLAHAVGAANFLATVPFLQQVVWDGISTLGLRWEQAYCLFIIYLEAIEDSLGVLHLANVFASGAQDTRIRAANQRYSDMFVCQPCDEEGDKDKDRVKGAKKWNNKDSPNAVNICKTYNFKDAEHPSKHLHKDGTCKYRHVCEHWVTGKGPGGMCEGNHPKYSCNNPAKTTTKPTQ